MVEVWFRLVVREVVGIGIYFKGIVIGFTNVWNFVYIFRLYMFN